MDRTTRIGVLLLGGLAVTALVIMVLVLFLGLTLWVGLVLLAVADLVELAWAYQALIRSRRRAS